ncbi:surface-adhesin E family protein [Craterilacuibacter sinensis]|uniref:Surface-adhesin protein E-like domain-containing protein n=1 Tax=Craterilacuibacter sinensis TaxID=2686017 RepID=A0A845BT06_9NEIS|nr:surface-adhesin E family protein [Craterilacuibacter sinensis]MXR38238.1 hypothetical protein [Craterilacuibacter sinensis]RQW28030.1 hypothetical protein EHS17_06570 [Rhodobacteraceae bacterium CH30]
MFKHLLRSTVLCTVFLAGCATQTSKPLDTGTPGGSRPLANAEWHNLGVSPSGNILHEIDGLSIRKQANNLFAYRDRKTIFNPAKENYLNTPKHKQSVNRWVVDCKARNIRLTGMDLFDENGRAIANYTYNDKQIRAMPVVRNSASYQQFEYVCGTTAN